MIMWLPSPACDGQPGGELPVWAAWLVLAVCLPAAAFILWRILPVARRLQSPHPGRVSRITIADPEAARADLRKVADAARGQSGG